MFVKYLHCSFLNYFFHSEFGLEKSKRSLFPSQVFEQLEVVGMRVLFLLKRTNFIRQNVNTLLDAVLSASVVGL